MSDTRSKVNTFYCTNPKWLGCNLALIYPYAGSDYPTEEELEELVCPKCRHKGFTKTPTDEQTRKLIDD